MAPPAPAPPPKATPDGVPLAGWGRRLAASFLDTVCLVPVVVGVILVAYFVPSLEDSLDDALAGDGLLLEIVLTVTLLPVSYAYNVGFLVWKGATPGKLMLGMRVRLRETPGNLSWGNATIRWVFKDLPTAGAVGPVAIPAALYSMLDGLWPLWDDKWQAIHDKLAKTNVVKVR